VSGHEHQIPRVIFGSQIRGAKIRAERARERAKQAVREADRAEAEAWSIRMELRRPGLGDDLAEVSDSLA